MTVTSKILSSELRQDTPLPTAKPIERWYDPALHAIIENHCSDMDSAKKQALIDDLYDYVELEKDGIRENCGWD
jgi:hypothetical protein